MDRASRHHRLASTHRAEHRGQGGKIPSPSPAALHSPLSQITDHVYLTGVRGAAQSRLLRVAGITHVLNVAADECGHVLYDGGLVVKCVYLRDAPDQGLLRHLPSLLNFITQAVAAGGRVLVHCLAGVSRSASVVIAYLMRDLGFSLKQAHDHVLSRRSVIRPNPGFWAELTKFERICHGRSGADRARGSIARHRQA